jgi:hypothetical protein
MPCGALLCLQLCAWPGAQQHGCTLVNDCVHCEQGSATYCSCLCCCCPAESEEPQAAKKKAAPKKKAAGGKKGAAASKKAAAEEGAAPARFVMDAGCAEHIKGAAAPALAGLAAHLDAAGFRQQMLPLLQAMAKVGTAAGAADLLACSGLAWLVA